MSRKKRLPDAEYLLQKLKELAGGSDQSVLSSQIWESLGWSRERFYKTRDRLIDSNILTYEGHYTKFVDHAKHGKIEAAYRVFISYAHRDEELKDELLKHLSPLRHMNLVEEWHDRKMLPGDEIKDEISVQLERANLIFLLVSADFLNSAYCYGIEMERAIERHKNKEAIVVPIILRHCFWEESPFAPLLAASKDGKPVSAYHSSDEAFTEVVKAIRKKLIKAQNI